MTIADMIRKIRKRGYGYVMIERYDTDDKLCWGATAECLDTDDREEEYGRTLKEVVERLNASTRRKYVGKEPK